MARMKGLRRLLVSAAAAVTMGASASYAWGPTGHSEVGAIADRLLPQHPRAAAQVRAILGDMPLAQVGPWADCIRSVSGPEGGFRYTHSQQYGAPCGGFETPELTAQMEDYVRRNWSNCSYRGTDGCHTQYHFLDVALQRPQYRDGLVGTHNYDIVHAINAAITVLRGRPSPAPFSFTRRDALILLVHFIGDIHQPLHVGSIYLDENGNPVDPDSSPAERARATTVTITNGGNSLVWPGAQYESKLHSAWDGVTPSDYSLDYARTVPPTTGPLNTWAGSWATDTLIQARGAFSGLTYSRQQNHQWTVSFTNQNRYNADRATVQRMQIEKAGARLAQVLVAIWPD